MNLNLLAAMLGLFVAACGTQPTGAQEAATGSSTKSQADLAAEADYPADAAPATPLTVGAERWGEVLAALDGKRVGAVVNHTSVSADTHLVDRLLVSGVDVARVFAPEHGFRGTASDGERVADGRDARTGLDIVSLYGKNKRPTAEQFAGLDAVVFDVQDVGTRFYTYISTMHYVMDAAAEYGVEVVVLDRPNPNGHYVDGPVLDTAYRSFIGMHPVPIVHGLTVGELARMINGEGWLSDRREADLTVVEVADYAVGQPYVLPIAPSPNLPNQTSIYLYPTLCLFEGTVASIGRGTDFPFQVIGHPEYPDTTFSFTPEVRPGAKYAKLKGERCYGVDLRRDTTRPSAIDWARVAQMRGQVAVRPFVDREDHFDACVGGASFREYLESGRDVADFPETYAEELTAYLEWREPYLLYARR